MRGAIDTADLGVTLMHEHVFVLSPEIIDNHPDVWGDEDKREADAINRLNELKSRGVDSIVDLTVIGLGRYIPRIARIAAATEINIVVATGLYTYNDVPLHFSLRGPGTLLDGPETHDRDVRRRHHRRHRRHRSQGGEFSSAPPTNRVSPPVWNGCCARSRRRTAKPACRSRRTPTPPPGGGWNSSGSSPRRASTCPGW